MRWDLQSLFSGHRDPKIHETMATVASDVRIFADKYANVVDQPEGPSALYILEAIQQLESIVDAVETLRVFAELLIADNSGNVEYQALSEEIDQFSAEVIPQLLFFERELMLLSDDDAERLATDPMLQHYHQYLRSIRKYQKHVLSDDVEQAILEKDSSGIIAWKSLWDRIVNNITYKIRVGGRLKKYTLNDFHLHRRHSDRTVRMESHQAFYKALRPQVPTISSVYDAIILDYIINDQLHGYESSLDRRNLENDVDASVIETMLDVVENGYTVGRDYFRFKSSMLHTEVLEIYDQKAPLGENGGYIGEEVAIDVILGALRGFSPEMYEKALFLIENKCIDTDIRDGKNTGSFCVFGPYNLHPYILCNYQGGIEDVLELAHEIGHALHFMFARQQVKFQSEPVVIISETVAIFVEMLVIDYLVQKRSDIQDVYTVLNTKIEAMCFNIFYQHVIFCFEKSLFEERANNPLTSDVINRLWVDVHQMYFDSAARMTEGYEIGWAWLPSIINQPFYSYSYIFGNLLSATLYRNYRQNQFSSDDFIAILQSGGSKNIKELMEMFDLNIYEQIFWEDGIREIKDLIELVTHSAHNISRMEV